MTCDNISSFSILHVAIKGGYQQVVNNIIHFVQQLPPNKEPILDTRNEYDKVRSSLNITCTVIKHIYMYVERVLYINTGQ